MEDYLKHLEELGISQEIPLKITIPCRRCQKVEIYNIYKDHYSFVENSKS
jgi:hypothetical protein